MQVLTLKPGRFPALEEIGEDLKSMQEFVGGNIEVARRFSDGACLVCNEEGKLLDLAPNRYLYGQDAKPTDYVAGDAFICGTKGEDFTSLTHFQAMKYAHSFEDWIKEEEYAGV